MFNIALPDIKERVESPKLRIRTIVKHKSIPDKP